MKVEDDAYTTIILHCAKYPASAVNGILLGTYDGVQNSVITRVIPLQHHWTALSPMAEAGLGLASASLPASEKIVGVYYAPSDVASSQKAELNITASKIAQTIASKLPGDAIALQVNNGKLPERESHALVGFTVSSSGQAKHVVADQVTLANISAIAKVKQAVAKGAWKNLYDFDGKSHAWSTIPSAHSNVSFP
jgi:hypothetical protein